MQSYRFGVTVEARTREQAKPTRTLATPPTKTRMAATARMEDQYETKSPVGKNKLGHTPRLVPMMPIKRKLVKNKLAKNKLGRTPLLERTFSSQAWSSSPKRSLSSRMRSYSPLRPPSKEKAQSSQTHLAGAEPMRGQAKLGMYTPAGCVSGSPGDVHPGLLCLWVCHSSEPATVHTRGCKSASSLAPCLLHAALVCQHCLRGTTGWGRTSRPAVSLAWGAGVSTLANVAGIIRMRARRSREQKETCLTNA